MLDVCLLGTGGMMPMPHRWLTSLLVRCEGSSVLIDCGEGTQIALKEAGLSPKSIDIMCFTHFHADHISGLVGMLLNMSNADRTEPVIMIGPRGLFNVVKSLRCIAPELGFELRFVELDQATEEYHIGPYIIKAFKVRHNIVCYGYSLSIERKPKFDPVKAKNLDIPLKYWSLLQKNEVIKDDISGRIYKPEMVLGAPRKGLKISYTTDTRPCENIVNAASGADLFICEGMYGDIEDDKKAKAYKHMTMREAANIAQSADPKPAELWFTHYSPSLTNPKAYIDEIREIFPAAVCGKDGMMKELSYED